MKCKCSSLVCVCASFAVICLFMRRNGKRSVTVNAEQVLHRFNVYVIMTLTYVRQRIPYNETPQQNDSKLLPERNETF